MTITFEVGWVLSDVVSHGYYLFVLQAQLHNICLLPAKGGTEAEAISGRGSPFQRVMSHYFFRKLFTKRKTISAGLTLIY